MKKRGRPRRNRELSRELILEKAIGLLKNSGHEAMTMRGLAGFLEITPMALYNYFPDRDSLIREMSDQIYAEVVSDFEELAGSDKLKLRTLLMLYYDAVAKFPELTTLIFNSKSEFSVETQKLNDHLLKLLSNLGLSFAKAKLWRDIFVDFTHGSAMATASSVSLSKSFVRSQKEDYANALQELLAVLPI